ncbi:hypothetical protein R50073_07510 [Maricurvus nonylphenolicus]|uniref:cbb3-type cytochrome oxidase assembly protein CcoS n=1 Tax=Maricurvus nonylphenolicus TaxID=1008307 RepID=UPI0036F40CBA
MESLYFLIPVALLLLAIAIRFLFWAVKSGQYDDLDTEAHRILFDDDNPNPKEPEKPKDSSKPDDEEEKS